MWQILRRNPKAFYWSLGLHVLFAALFFVGVQIERPVTEAGSKARVVQATIVSDAALEAMVAESPSEQARRPADRELAAEEPEPVPDTEPEPEKAPEAEVMDEAEVARREAERLAAEGERGLAAAQAEAERRAAAERQAEAARAEARRLAEAERKAAEARRRAEAERLAAAKAEAERRAEAQRRAEAERLAAEAAARAEAQRRAAEARAQEERRAEAERQRRLADEARQMAELEERRLVEELAQERIEQEASQLAAEKQRRLAAEQAQRTRDGDPLSDRASEQLAREANRYIPVIRDRVRQFWVRPPATGRDLATIVSVRLIPGGDVVPNSVRVVQTSGNTAFDQSVVAAVNQASPLPVPSGPVFESFREFTFTFRP